MSLELEITPESATGPGSADHEPSTLVDKIERMLKPEERLKEDVVLDWPDVTKKKPRPSFKNILFFMKRFGIALHDDAFKWEYFVTGMPNRVRLDDKAILDLMFALDYCGLKIGKNALWDLLMGIAQLRTVHPLREQFNQMEAEWIEAGRPEVLDTWLNTYCYVGDTPYTRAVGAKTVIAAVRRIRRPGHAFKYMLVLEGPQDIRKSAILRILDWMTISMTIWNLVRPPRRSWKSVVACSFTKFQSCPRCQIVKWRR